MTMVNNSTVFDTSLNRFFQLISRTLQSKTNKRINEIKKTKGGGKKIKRTIDDFSY